MERTINYQSADGKWHDLVVYDLIDSAAKDLPAGVDMIQEAMESGQIDLYQDACEKIDSLQAKLQAAQKRIGELEGGK